MAFIKAPGQSMACSTLAVTGRKVYVIRRPDVAQNAAGE
jgi:hypothetical protein